METNPGTTMVEMTTTDVERDVVLLVARQLGVVSARPEPLPRRPIEGNQP